MLRSAVYVHAIGPDYVFVYSPGCPNRRITDVCFERTEKAGDIFYVIRRSEDGYSVPFDAEVEVGSGEPTAYLIRRNTSRHEAIFRGEEPPPPQEVPKATPGLRG